MTKSLATLPDDTAQLLRDSKSTDRNLFLGLVKELRDLGWPLRSIAEPFGVTRAAAKNWENSADKAADTLKLNTNPLPSVPVTAHGQEYRPKKITPDVTKADLALMIKLAAEAKKVTRWSANNSPERKAAKKLEEKILFYTQQRKVPVSVIARHLGVTRRSVAQRIEKYKD